MEKKDIYSRAEITEERALITRTQIQRLIDEFQRQNGGAIISKITISRGKVNLCIQFPKDWRPFRGYNTGNS